MVPFSGRLDFDIKASEVDQIRDNIASVFNTGKPVEFEVIWPLLNGKRHLNVRLDPELDVKGSVIYVMGITQDITAHKLASEQLRAFSARLRSAKEEEDIRIAREIHDEMGSGLASLRWELEELEKSISEDGEWARREAVSAKVKDTIRLTDITISTMRRIAAELRPSILDDLGLVEAIEWQTQQFQTRTGIITHCDCVLEDLDFDPDQSTAIFRIFQEAHQCPPSRQSDGS